MKTTIATAINLIFAACVTNAGVSNATYTIYIGGIE